MRPILQTYNWKIDLGDKNPEAVALAMRELAQKMIPIQPHLRGFKLESTTGTHRLTLRMRVAGHTRWEIQATARKLIIMFLRKAFVPTTNIELELVTTERNGRELALGEGRTPMTRRPRATVKADGTPWDQYEWWGEDLTTGTDLPASGPPTHDPPVPEVWSSLE